VGGVRVRVRVRVQKENQRHYQALDGIPGQYSLFNNKKITSRENYI
jgi:hypothetical protein